MKPIEIFTDFFQNHGKKDAVGLNYAILSKFDHDK